MKRPKHMSPTSLQRFESNLSEYYLYYLSDNRPDKEPQTRPMAAGSGFDAFLKNHLHEMIYGKGHDVRYSLDALLESQLEPHNRTEGRAVGQILFDFYIKSGALADLVRELGKAASAPRFEIEIRATIAGVPLLGKPDIFYTSSEGMRITDDCKVNGYYSKASPLKGYIKIRPGNMMHKDCILGVDRGLEYNMVPFEDIKKDWADQLCTYALLAGSELGSEDWMVGIEQIAWGPTPRVATHRGKISPQHQRGLIARYQKAWEVVTSDHIFRDMSFEQSAEKCRNLDAYKDFDSDFKIVSK